MEPSKLEADVNASSDNQSQSLSQVHPAPEEPGHLHDESRKTLPKYRQYCYRFVVLGLFLLAVLINGLPFKTCIPIAKEIHTIYGVSSQIISFTSSVYMMMHPFFTFCASESSPSSHYIPIVIVSRGFALSVKLGILATIVGFAIRTLVNFSFYFVVLGQIIAGVGRPLILNCQATLAQNWFFPANRTAILVAVHMVQTLSNMLRGYDPDEDTTLEEGRRLGFRLMALELLLCSTLLPALCLLRRSPPTPPSAFANTDVRVPFRQVIPQLFRNKDFVLTMAAFSIYMGVFKGFAVTTPYLLGPFGFNSSQIANFGTLTLVGGIASSLGISSVVKRFRRYKLTSLLLMGISLTICGLFYPALLTGISYLSYLAGFLAGFALVPLGPVLMELSCEAIFPLNGSFAVGILYSGATLFSIVATSALTLASKGTDSDKFSSLIASLLILICQLAGAILFLFVNERQNRTKELSYRSILRSSFSVRTDSLALLKDERFHVSSIQSLMPSIGGYPTYYPYGDQLQFIQDPEVLDPDNDPLLQENKEVDQN